MKPATAQRVPVAATADRQFSPAQVADFSDQRDRLQFRLEESIAALNRVEDELARVVDAESQAKRFLSLSEGAVGFSGQRERAQEVLAHCSVRRADVELRLESRRKLVEDIRARLTKIPVDAVKQRNEIHELARSLAQPLP